jgi:hypothetical protein
MKELVIPAGNRRSFVRNLALASAAAGVVVSTKLADAQSTGPTDVDILNFALNLEYLEAEFYTVATTGLTIDHFGITITGGGNAGATTGGSQVPFISNSLIGKVALELAADERYHVALLQNTITSLGGIPIAKPAINLAALGSTFYATETDFLALSRVFEEIGVTAYGGAAGLILNKTVLGYAARILATEAEHVGFIRALINQYGVMTSPLDAVDVVPPPTGSQYFSTNSDAITAVRTPGEVLYIALGGASTTTGGFFPAGVNGSLNTSSATSAVTDGVTFYLTPNPDTGSGGLGTVNVVWNCPSTVQYVEVHIGTPSGPLFTVNGGVGSMMTNAWVTDGMIFYLQDVTYPKNTATRTAANTLATAIAHIQ